MAPDLKDARARRNLLCPKTFVDFSVDDCHQAIHQRFERQALLCANDPAVRLLSGDVTYSELNAAANRAARFLLATVGAEFKPIALMLGQGHDSVLWTLAVLKAGFCYAPLDHRLPEPILSAMITDLRPGAVISDHNHQDLSLRIATNRTPVIRADVSRNRFPCENLDRFVKADGIASIFYTSGSTGVPKGVADCHRNVLHNILRYTNTLKFSRGDILSMVQNPSFSGTASSLFGALLNGASIAPFDLQSEGLEKLSPWLRCARVTVFHGVPSIFRQLSDPVTRFPDIRLIRLEGDRASALDIEHFRTHFQDHCTLVNGLGATECGLVRQFFIDKNSFVDEAAKSIPVGYPVPGMTVRVIDDQGVPLPTGSSGEIVVESRFLTANYWGDPMKTAERFEKPDHDLRRYKSGDLGRMEQDGCLIHLGRVDHRIRIAGEFIETAELEKLILEIPGISQVSIRDIVDQAGDRRLCAYIVADANARVTVNKLRESLSARTAQHIVPTAFVFLDALPLTKDLKIDYRKLPLPGGRRPVLANDYVAPRTTLERRIKRIWSQVLNIDSIGVTDSFLDLGGDSLHAMQIVTRLRDQHGQNIDVATLFEHRTIRSLAIVLQKREAVEGSVPEDTGDA